MVWPLVGGEVEVTAGFGDYEHGVHRGIDLVGSTWPCTVVAAARGRVVFAGRDPRTPAVWTDPQGPPPGLGFCVAIDHGGGVLTLYAHLAGQPFVADGDCVQAGEHLGIMGDSGYSFGAHLHFELHVGLPSPFTWDGYLEQRDGTCRDPLPCLEKGVLP